jgi:tetratricopeptide (TPR) repeat protein
MASCGGNGAQMRQQLEALEQQNRSGEQMLNDSLAESLVDYFDRHGDANERMRARYILGRTYYCMGELPRALETYYEAADCADTTAADCDFAKLSRIHAQSAVIYYDQVVPYSQLKELRQAVYYAKKGCDTLIAIECYAQQANAYSLLHEYDSAIFIKEHASSMYEEIGMKDDNSSSFNKARNRKGQALYVSI